MQSIRKKIVTDEGLHPIAVQIDYADWLEIEKIIDFKEKENATKQFNINKYAGVISLTEDPLQFQSEIRGEWH
nr:hypothetical protein [Desulfobulbaceae bacterium]